MKLLITCKYKGKNMIMHDVHGAFIYVTNGLQTIYKPSKKRITDIQGHLFEEKKELELFRLKHLTE